MSGADDKQLSCLRGYSTASSSVGKMSKQSQESVFDCVIVGAGIEGSCTARYAAALGKRTLCLEQVKN